MTDATIPSAGSPPLSVLHVCMGNICRSPMAERLLVARLRDQVGEAVDGYLLSHSAGLGGWHAGQPMQPGSARQVHERGGDTAGYLARQLQGEHIDASDLVLTADGEQAAYVVGLRPDAAARTFVLGEFGRLLHKVDAGALPTPGRDPQAAYTRGVALVAAVDAVRAGRSSEPGDDLDDPYGRSDRYFARAADEIETTLVPFVRLLLGT